MEVFLPENRNQREQMLALGLGAEGACGLRRVQTRR